MSSIQLKNKIKQYDTDPTNPTAETAWVLRTKIGTGSGTPIGMLLALTKVVYTYGPSQGEPIGMLLGLTHATDSYPSSYQLSYKTKQGTVVRTTLS